MDEVEQEETEITEEASISLSPFPPLPPVELLPESRAVWVLASTGLMTV
jgi:hypothetical protein